MATTNFAWTTPALGSANNVPSDMASLAQQIDTTMAARTSSDNIIIGSTTYARSGSWATETVPAAGQAVTSGTTYGWSVTKTAPFSAPAGWTFDVYQISSNGYSVVGTASVSGATIAVRVLSVVSAGPTIQLGWRLVKL